MREYCVASHTHWDREWYLPLECMKLRLCDLVDHCLELLNREPDYVFHLDAQTVVLEDYLEIRPSKRSELEKYIKSGRLIVGPWYLQNDFYLTSGEATVRNLLEGNRLANEFGKCDSVGYAPDQFGNISQLPQILRGFGIDNFVFGRGFAKEQPDGTKSPSEFIWESPDGSSVLAIHLHNRYNNGQHISADIEKAKLILEYNDAEFSGSTSTPYILLMNGVDHLEPQPDLLPVLKDLNNQLPDGYGIHQCKLSDYVDQLRSHFEENGFPNYVHVGEMRQGYDTVILKGTLSSRFYLKAANVKAQTMLENVLEPLYTMLELAGMTGVYSSDHFRYMWKQLLKNHPHDSICGCSRDEVHKHMEDNYERLATTTEDMLMRGMKLAAGHLGMCNRNSDNYIITVANTTQAAMDSVIDINIDIPKTENAENIEIRDNSGNLAEYVILTKETSALDGLSPLNLPGTIPVDRFKVSLRTGMMNPFAFKGFIVNASREPIVFSAPTEEYATDSVTMENEYLKVIVHTDGSVELLDKETGHHCFNLLDIEDTADQGDSYVYIPMANEQPILASAFPATVTIQRVDKLVQELTIKRTMQIPAAYDFAAGCRSDNLTDVPVSLTLRLNAGSKHLDCKTSIDNNCSDHRMRLLVNTEVESHISYADIPFDLVHHTAQDHPMNTWSKVLPNSTFAALQTDDYGLAVLTEGAHEYEHIEEKRALAFTLLRATGIISRNYENLEKAGGELWVCPDNQCLRKMNAHFGVYPYNGTVLEAGVPVQSIQFRTGIPCVYTSSDERKFMQGRPAVQDTRLQEYYFYADPYSEVIVADNCSLLTVEGTGLIVTALKKAESGNNIILRTTNLSSIPVQPSINICGTIDIGNMDESKSTKDGLVFQIGAKEIRTYVIEK